MSEYLLDIHTPPEIKISVLIRNRTLSISKIFGSITINYTDFRPVKEKLILALQSG